MGLPVYVRNGLNVALINCSFNYPFTIDPNGKGGWYYVAIDDNMDIEINHLCNATFKANVGTLPSLTAEDPNLFYDVTMEDDTMECPEGQIWSCESKSCVKAPESEGNGKIECFIATAATGGPNSMEVEFLRNIRDNILMKTSSGRKLFTDFYARYYKFSPLIAQEMDKDPLFKDLMNMALVTPIINYYKLAVDRPLLNPLDFEKIPVEYRRHMEMMYNDMEQWVSRIPIPYKFNSLTQEEICNDVYIILNYVFRDSVKRSKYLDDLENRKILPLRLENDVKFSYKKKFVEMGLSNKDMEKVLGEFQN